MPPESTDLPLDLSAEVAAAQKAVRPVVALESTVLTHGLPKPTNRELGLGLEQIIREAGAVPATIAVLDGRVRVGLSADELSWLALEAEAVKVSRRDFGPALARGLAGGTTVAATCLAAHRAGIRVIATGGVGGVHHGQRGDVSADLPELARTPVAVVCAGAKSILDLPRTLEWLETAGVPVIGWGTETFPAFFSRSSGLPVRVRADTPAEAAAILSAHWSMGLDGALVAVPVPPEAALDPETVEEALARAEREAEERGIRGAAVTPYLLSRLVELTDGATLQANLALLENNAKAAAALALALG